MKRSATGRILIWRGGSLWIGLAGEPTELHSHHAIQISLAFPRGQVRFQRPLARWTSYDAAIVAAHVTHAFEARGQLVAQIFVDPEGHEGRILQQRFQDAEITALTAPDITQEIAGLAASYSRQADDAELIALARMLVTVIVGRGGTPKTPPDTRIAEAVELIRGRLNDPIPLGAIAGAVSLSPDRFRHLFVQETGIAFRPYMLWLRLERSLAAYVAGSPLTDAAYAGGFADSAHFSRTFKKMFGIAPASLRPE